MQRKRAGLTPRQGLGFTELPSFNLDLLARLNERVIAAQHQRDFGLSLHEVRIVGVIGEYKSARFRDICQMLELEKGQASRLVTGLIANGYLQRKTQADDQRSVILMLTDAGRSICEAILAAARERNERWLSVLDVEDKATFLKCLGRLTESIRTLTAGPSAAPARSTAGGSRATVSRSGVSDVTITLDAALAQQLRDTLHSALEPAFRVA